MGGCFASQQKRRYNPSQKHDQVPKDILTLNKQTLPSLLFHSLMTSIKLKRCSFYKKISIKIEFGGYSSFELMEKLLEKEVARWAVDYKIEFKATQYELRQKFLTFTFFDEGKKTIGSLKINLYLMAIGPYHQDFALNFANAQNARLSFNLKIAQVTYLKICISEAQMKPTDKEYPGDKFAFLIKALLGDRIQESEQSYVNVISLDMKDASDEETQNNLEKKGHLKANKQLSMGYSIPSNNDKKRKLKRSNSFRSQNLNFGEEHEVSSKQLKWRFDSTNELSIEQTIPLYQIQNASLNIIFLAIFEKGSTPSEETKQLCSQCYISINKLLNYPIKETKLNQLDKSIYEIREEEIQVKNWHHGKENGKSIFKIKVQIQKHIKQMQVCVRTQNGILESSPVFNEQQGTGKIPEEINKLKKLTGQVQTYLVELFQDGMSNTLKKKEDFIKHIIGLLQQNQKILESSSKQSKLMFHYEDESSLLKGQAILIDLGFKLITCLRENIEELHSTCFSLLTALIKRGQLTLTYMGYSKLQKEECSKNVEPSKFIKKKHQVALNYQQLNHDLLKFTLKALQIYNSDSQKQFAELFCAFAYFRIPLFRNEILVTITRPNDPDIEEWRGTEYNLIQGPSNTQINQQNTFQIMFDWENNFYKVIEKEEKYATHIEELKDMLKESQWESRLQKRGGAFFAFIRYWVSYIQNITVISKYISWKYFPGYTKILHAFLVEMKTKELTYHSEAMRKAAASMLSNEKLLNTFILILYKKTNLNDQANTLKTFEYFSMLFESINKRSRTFPTSFDLKLFIKSIKYVFEGDSSYCIGKVLLLLYQHFSLFPIEFRFEISMYFLSKVFFKLFLHWSPNVRSIFHHLLYIRIYHESSKPMSSINAKDQEIYKLYPEYRIEISAKYRKLLITLQNIQNKSAFILKERKINKDKELFKYLRKKIAEKRKNKNKETYPEDYSRPDTNLKNIQSLSTKKISTFQRLEQLEELSKPKLERYNSVILNTNLKNAMEKETKGVAEKDVILNLQNHEEMKSSTNFESEIDWSVKKRPRKSSLFEKSFQTQLEPMKDEEIPYLTNSLEEYHKVGENFIKCIEKNKDSIPQVRLEVSLDQKEIRPTGIDVDLEEW